MGIQQNFHFALYHKWHSGPRDLITDVPGVLVGQTTLHDSQRAVHTGVTAVLPHGGNLFREKVVAGAAVINGFGKSVGLVQAEELGTLETPIVLTNTFAVGTALNALIRLAMDENPEIGVTTGTVNGLVAECNDGELSDIRGLYVTQEDVLHAINRAGTVFDEGAVGAGSGMICMGLKGGIGSASRVVPMDGKVYTVGALVMTNFGMDGNLVIGGRHIGQEILDGLRVRKEAGAEREKGSVIIVLGTDVPMSARQLKRVARRSAAALGRVGSFLGNGSGDIAIAFSTGNRISHFSDRAVLDIRVLHDESLDPIFEASVEAAEEAVLSSLWHAETVTGIRGKQVLSLRDAMQRAGIEN